MEVVAPVSLPIIVNCVAFCTFTGEPTPMFTELATKVLLFGASSSPKKKGTVAPTPLPAPSFTFIEQTDWSCNIKV